MNQPAFTIQEIEIHYSRPVNVPFAQVGSMEQAHAVLVNSIDMRKIDHKEFFWVLLLDHSNHVLGVSEIGRGTTSHVSVNVKEIFQLALRTNASSIILAHNHPSGNPKASRADIALTDKIREGAKLLDFQVHDHLILTSSGCTSLLQEGHL